jgi:hypothetical protein
MALGPSAFFAWDAVIKRVDAMGACGELRTRCTGFARQRSSDPRVELFNRIRIDIGVGSVHENTTGTDQRRFSFG